MRHIMMALVGEQPIANLLPIHYSQPDQVVLVYTDRTHQVSERLRDLLGRNVEVVKVAPYDFTAIYEELRRFIYERNWAGADLTFNLTGGTKPMALAAYRLAEQMQRPFLYLQSEGGKSLIYRYDFTSQGATLATSEEIPAVLTLDDYLRAHLGDYEEGPPKDEFEKTVYGALLPIVDEVKTSVKHGGALEIDLMLRCGNQVGIAEVKGGRKAQRKEGIDQLNTAAEQRYLGTYTQKFLILDRPLGSNNQALAKAHRIKVIELCSAASGTLSEEDRCTLTKTIREALGGQA